MTKGLLTYGFLILILTISVSGQVFLPKKAYMHLVGRIDTDQEITMNLVKVNDSLYADLVFNASQCNPSILSGKADEKGNFLLKYPFCDTGMVFRGRFVNRQSLSGNYETSNGEVIHPFVLVESYPEGSIPLLVYYSTFSRNLVEKPGSPMAAISQCLIIPGESSNPVLSDSLRIRMISGFSGKQDGNRDPEIAISSGKNTFLLNYFSSNESLYKSMPDAATLNWTLLKFMHILYNDNNILTYYLLNYAYTGGAHGMETIDYSVVSTRTGEEITLADIFITGYEPSLSSLLTRKLKEISGISPDAKLSENGFFIDEVVPNSNFYITDIGIGFLYNHYEIAPYVNGPTDILLPFQDLKDILKSEGPGSIFLSRR